ncbi:hypothetical protein ACWDZ6_27150 [Streptomyces sp. NPDC002926]
MHRTRIAAKVLVAAAAWAVTGCVAVEPRPAPALPPPPPSGSPAHVVEAQIAQGPAREVLEPPSPAATPVARSAAPPPPPVAGQLPRERPEPRPAKPGTAKPPAPVPAPPAPSAARPDVCALGEDYAHLPPDSLEARICREAYGN